jgi:hypothetical protein
LREEKLKQLEERERELDERRKVLEEEEPRAFVKITIILKTSSSLKHTQRSTSKPIHRQPRRPTTPIDIQASSSAKGSHHENTLEDIHASLSAEQPHHFDRLQPHEIIRQARTSQAYTSKVHTSQA